MRLKANQPEARKVHQVLLNGKPVPMVNEFDDKEGWVTAYVPDLPDNPYAAGEEPVEDDETRMAGMRLVKRSGEVKVIFYTELTQEE